MVEEVLQPAAQLLPSASGMGQAAKIIGIGAAAIFLVALLAIGGWLLFRRFANKKKYDYSVHIYHQEPGSSMPIERWDRGGIFTDPKSNIKAFWLEKNGVPLNPDNIPITFNNTGKKIVTLLQTGLKNFRYVNPSVSSNPGFIFKVGEDDVNWAINSFSQWWSHFKKDSFIQKYGGMMIFALAVVGSLMLFYFVAQKFDTIGTAAQALQTAAEALRSTNVGTVLQ